MAYETKEFLKMMKTYHEVESQAKDFIYLSSWAMKYKDKIKVSAENTLKAIEEYKKLPEEIRKEIEKDKSLYVNKIDELENACKKAMT